MTGICGHIPGVTCSNCAPRPPSIVPWPSSPPDALGRIADALEKLVVALTAADRYFANEAKQREEAEPDPLDDASIEEVLTLAAKASKRWARTLELLKQAEEEERQQQREEAEPDPLDENDHRDRLDGAGTRWTNASDGCWASGTHHVLELASLVGPLTFAPDAEPDPLDENDHRDRLIADRRRIVRHGQGHWHTPATSGTWCDADCTEMSLQHWARAFGPLAFATDAAQEDSSTHYYPTNIDRAPDGTAWSWGVAECHCNRPWRHE